MASVGTNVVRLVDTDDGYSVNLTSKKVNLIFIQTDDTADPANNLVITAESVTIFDAGLYPTQQVPIEFAEAQTLASLTFTTIPTGVAITVFTVPA